MNRRQFLQSTLVTLVAPALPVASRHIIAEFPNLTYVESQWAKDFEWQCRNFPAPDKQILMDYARQDKRFVHWDQAAPCESISRYSRIHADKIQCFTLTKSKWKTLDDAIVKAGSKRINELLGKARA